MRSLARTVPPDPETAEVLDAIGFAEAGTRVYVHRELEEAGRFDASALADDAIVPQAVRWIEEAARARGRAELRRDIGLALG